MKKPIRNQTFYFIDIITLVREKNLSDLLGAIKLEKVTKFKKAIKFKYLHY